MAEGAATSNGLAKEQLLSGLKSLAAALAIVLPVAVILPLQIHGSNAYDFNLAFSDLFHDLRLFGLSVAVAIAGVLWLLPGRWHRRLTALAVGIAVAVWVQGQLLVWNYGVLDGTTPEWGRLPQAAIVDTLVWLLIPGLALLFDRIVYSQAIAVAFALIFIQAAPAALDWRDEPAVPDFHHYQFDDKHKFSLSQRDNVIVLMLDAYQSDIFHDILLEEPALTDAFDGFTYFRNALAGYSKTYPSVALMMSGRWYENERPIQDFITRSFSRQSLPAALRRAGWRVDLFPHVKRVVQVSPDIASNAMPLADCATARRESGQLLDLGLFRASPHWLKPLWLNEYDWQFARIFGRLCESPDDDGGSAASTESNVAARSDSPHAAVRFIENARSLNRVELDESAFKFYHLMIPHAPFRLDENLNVTRLPRGPEGFRQQSRSALELIMQFLNSLKAAGVYDEATIVIVSDHGGGEYIDRVNLNALPDHLVSGRPPDDSGVPGKHLASGLPLMLIKRSGDSGELRISDVPASLADLAATLSRAIGLGQDYPGADLYALAEQEARKRRYLFFEFNGWRSAYLPEMIEYTVEGFSWDPTNWRRSGRTFPAPQEKAEPRIIEVPVNREFDFLPTSRYARILGRGWSEPQDNGMVWSEAARAAMEMQLPDDAPPPRSAHFDIMPFLARGALPSARIRVSVNGASVGEWEVDGRGWQSVNLPEEAGGDETLVFEFEFPDADAPINHGYSLDRRHLGMALYGMRIEVDER
jgi:hypothetical protein